MRERRRALAWDQRELAERVGVSRQWVIDAEKGKPGTELGLVMRAVRALQLDLFVQPQAPATPTHAHDDSDPLEAVIRRARGDRDG